MAPWPKLIRPAGPVRIVRRRSLTADLLDNALLDGRYLIQAKIASGGTRRCTAVSTPASTVRSP